MRVWATRAGFTITELVIVITVIAILATLAVVGYGNLQQRGASAAMMSDLEAAATSMEQAATKNNGVFPGTIPADLTTSPEVSLAIRTADDIYYVGLSAAQNATLFVNLCNDAMPIQSADGTITYATTCTGQWGIDIGGGSHGSYLSTPIQSNFEISSCPGCTDGYYAPYNTYAAAVRDTIRETFLAQGGTFPVTVTNNTPVALPTPTQNGGSSDSYCIEATHDRYSHLHYRVTSDTTVPEEGTCDE